MDAANLPDFEGASLVGSTLCERWRVLRPLGRGGMSTVYEAEDEQGVRVAIKVLHEGLARSRRTRERFLREGRLLNAVGHPDCVRMLDSRQTPGGLLLLVMELLDGETLRRRCKKAQRGSLDAHEALSVGRRVLGVLSVAHTKGIVHRDIKPENVFLTSDGEVKVLDFGVAAIRDEALQDASITQSGASLGTPAFMAPEQARGRQSQVDARTDIWALGATLFYCLTGRHVHDDALTANEAVIFAATQQAPSLRRFRPDVSADVARVVDRALAFEPGDRWQSAAAMQDAIVAAERASRTPSLQAEVPDPPATETVDSLPPPASTRFGPRRFAWLAVAGVVALAAVAFAATRAGSAPGAHPDRVDIGPPAASPAETVPRAGEETVDPATKLEEPKPPKGLGSVAPGNVPAASAVGEGSHKSGDRGQRHEPAERRAREPREDLPGPLSDAIPNAVLDRRK